MRFGLFGKKYRIFAAETVTDKNKRRSATQFLLGVPYCQAEIIPVEP
jgi:hypothetical protein